MVWFSAYFDIFIIEPFTGVSSVCQTDEQIHDSNGRRRTTCAENADRNVNYKTDSKDRTFLACRQGTSVYTKRRYLQSIQQSSQGT